MTNDSIQLHTHIIHDHDPNGFALAYLDDKTLCCGSNPSISSSNHQKIVTIGFCPRHLLFSVPFSLFNYAVFLFQICIEYLLQQLRLWTYRTSITATNELHPAVKPRCCARKRLCWRHTTPSCCMRKITRILPTANWHEPRPREDSWQLPLIAIPSSLS